MAAAKKTYVDEFKARVDKMEKDAAEVGLNFTVICREAGISRATPDRWRKKTPKTILLIAQIEGIIERERTKIERRAAR